MRTIPSRFVMLVATAAVAPLVLYGAVSVYSLRVGTRQSVIDGNPNRWSSPSRSPPAH